MVEIKKDENGAGSPQKGKSGGLEPEQFRKLFIGGLSLNTTDESLHAYYSQYGTLVDCIVMRDPQTKRSRGFGFVSFQCQEELDRAMTARPHTIDGKVVDPKRAVPRDQSARAESSVSTKRLYVSGVREEHTEEQFHRYFSEFGSVAKVEIIQDKNTNKNRGFAFINFDDYDPVDKCVLLKSHMIGGYRCDVKKALSREEMQKAQQHDRDRMERGMRSRGGPGMQPYGGGGRGGSYGPPPSYGPYGGGGYGPPPPAWGPPAGPPQPQWGAYGGYSAYGQPPAGPTASASSGSWGGAQPAASGGPAPAGVAAAEQGQWGQAQGWGQQGWGQQQAAAGGWGAAPAAAAAPTPGVGAGYADVKPQDAHASWAQSAAVPGGVPPPAAAQQQQWASGGRY